MSKLLVSATLLGGTTVLGIVGIQNLLTGFLGSGSGLTWSSQGQPSVSVPEPSFGSLALLGVGALILLRRRNK